VTSPPCAFCGRHVRLRGISPQGRICSNCCAKRRSGPCSRCGQVRRLAGRDPDGGRWCQRCARRHQAAATVADHLTQVVAAVAVIEPLLSLETIERAVTQAASAARTARLLAEHLAAYPDALSDDASGSVPVLRRLAEALQAAGAHRVRVLDPPCVECGQKSRARKRVGAGWICSTCCSRIRRPCDRCGHLRRPYARDPSGVLCVACVRRQRSNESDRAVTAGIVDAVRAHHTPRLDTATVTAMVRMVAPRPVDRRRLAAHVNPITLPAGAVPLPVTRLIIMLTAAGASSLPRLHCDDCGSTVGGDGHGSLTAIKCGRCARRCPGCGRPRRRPEEKLCSRCRKDKDRRRGDCAGCPRRDRALDDRGLCRTCRERAGRHCLDCGSSATPMHRVDGGEVCDRCALRHDVNRFLPAQTTPPLQRLREAILAAEPETTRSWLTRPRAGNLLAALHDGRLKCTHAALDTLSPGRDLDHLRALLVAAGVLPTDAQRVVDRLGEELAIVIDQLADGDRRCVRAWLRWRVLARLRQAADAGHDLTRTIHYARATTAQVVAFVTALHRAGRQLGTCRQADIDGWFSTPPVTRSHVRSFLSWAHRRGHVPRALRLPAFRRGQLNAPADPEQRWAVARRLVHDDTLDIADRVVGALIVLYAQPITRIVQLTTSHVAVADGQVTVALGPDRLQLPEPFATLITKLPHHRRVGTAAHLPNPWLFPSARAGQHATPGAVANRLRRIGVTGRGMRQAALMQLAAEIPPAMLAGILGIHATTAVKWTRLAGGDWTSYTAARTSST